MASVDIDLLINTANGANSISDVRKQLNALRSAMLEVGSDSAEFDRLAQAAAELDDRVGDVNSRMQAFNPDGFQALTSFATKAAGAVSAVTGAMTLFGVESEDTQKALMKVQAAMALTQGLDAVKGLGEAFNNLKAVGVRAFTALKGAIGSTGIGLIVIAAGAIYAYWDDIKAAISGVDKEQKKLLEDTKATVAAAEKKLDTVSKEENILKLNGKSEREILNMKIAATKETITGLEAQITQQEAMKKSQVEAAERNRDILKGILDFLMLPLKLLLSSVDLVTEKLHDWGAISDETFSTIGNLSERFTTSVAEMIFDPEDVASEADAAIQETKDKLTELKNQQAGFQLEINAIDRAAYDESKKLSDQKAADHAELMDQILKDEIALGDALIAEQEEINARIAKAEAERAKQHRDYINEKKQREQEAHDHQKALHEAEQLREEMIAKARLDAIAGLFGSLANLAGKNQKLMKSFSVAEATINTYKGVTAALADPLLPFPIKLINAAAVLASGIANVRKILAVEPGSSGGGTVAPSMANGGGGIAAINTPPAQPQPSTQLDQNGNVIGSNGNQQQQPQRVYVVETDIRETLGRVAVAEQAVTFR